MPTRARPGGIRHGDGFTIVELLITLILSSLVLLSVYQLFISQSQLLSSQQESIDARDSARGAAALLAWELRSAAATANDLIVIDPDSLVLRSVHASGVICSNYIIGVAGRFGLRQVSGTFSGETVDSVMLYNVSDQTWNIYNISGAWNGGAAWLAPPSGGGTPVCYWGDSTTSAPRPQAAVELDVPLSTAMGISVGGPVHEFRRTKYGLFERNARWWLGRQVAGGDWELITGPTEAPADDGLVFAYYDASDVVTANPALVARVEFLIRAQSLGRVSSGGQNPNGTMGDSITMSVYLRNNITP